MKRQMGNSSRIARNSIFLYIRMFFLMTVSLYTSRIILNALGVVDFGVNNAVAGFVSMFSLISASLVTTISRFFTFELGNGEMQNIKRVFSTSLNLQIILIVIIILFAETVGLWFLNKEMIIPSERLVAANWVYQFSLISFCVNLISVPYNAAIIAHEDMSSFAYISIAEAFLKLLITYLIAISPWDKLILYSFFIMVVSIIIRIIYGAYCKRQYEEVGYSFVLDKRLLKQMAVFAGWNYLGAGAVIMRTSGLNLLLNLFFGTTTNAARGIATQVESAITQFVSNFTMSMNPQICKSFAVNNLNYMYQLICIGAKYAFFMMLLLVVPIFIEAPYILKLWLNIVPDDTIIFVRLTVLVTLADILSTTLGMAMQASGKIKKFQIIVSSIVLLIFPVTYICFRLGYKAYICYIICFVTMIIKLFFELPLLKDMIGLPVSMYLKEVIFRIIPVLFIVPIAPYYVYSLMSDGFTRLLVVCSASVIWGIIIIYLLGAKQSEKQWLRNKIRNLGIKAI